MGSEKENKNFELAKRYVQIIWNEHRIDKINTILAPDFMVHYEQGSIKGREKWITEFYSIFFNALPDLHVDIDEMMAHDDKVSLRWTLKGIFENELFGVAPTKKNIAFNGMTWMRIENDLIMESWNSWNMSYLLQQISKEVSILSGILPICVKCKKIRNSKGYWNQVEQYIEEHSEAQFSHGICQSCADEMYGHLDWYQKRTNKEE